jgi:arylsulfatase A-like enzyme
MKPKNVILITIDCLRADHVSCYGYSRNTTPKLDEIANNGILFKQAIVNGCPTLSSFPAILASNYPPLHIDRQADAMKNNTSIAAILSNSDYQTAAFHSNPFLSRVYGYDKGFDIFDDNLGNETSFLRRSKFKLEDLLTSLSLGQLYLMLIRLYDRYFRFRIEGRESVKVRADILNRKAISWLKDCSGKFFLWLHYMDVHHPCSPPDEYLNQFLPRTTSMQEKRRIAYRPIVDIYLDKMSNHDYEVLISLYDASIRYVDEAVGQLIVELKKLNLYDDTVIIITADHGQEFGEHGRFIPWELYDTSLHVPLIMANSGAGEGLVIEKQVSLIDLAPTILDLVSIESADNFQGRSLLPVIEGRNPISPLIMSIQLNLPSSRFSHIRAISCRSEDWKYICTEKYDGTNVKQELYDLKNDPGETKNLQLSQKEKAREFELKVLQFKHMLEEEDLGKITSAEKKRIKDKINKVRGSGKI